MFEIKTNDEMLSIDTRNISSLKVQKMPEGYSDKNFMLQLSFMSGLSIFTQSIGFDSMEEAKEAYENILKEKERRRKNSSDEAFIHEILCALPEEDAKEFKRLLQKSNIGFPF